MKIVNTLLVAGLSFSLSACCMFGGGKCHDGSGTGSVPCHGKEKPCDGKETPCHKKMPTPEEMQKGWIDSMKVSENHKALESLVGNFTVKSTFWMDPAKAPEVDVGTAKHTSMFGGKFVKVEYKGKSMGSPFEGTGYYGFNNVSGKYESMWLDSMATSIGLSEGTYDAATKTFTFTNTEVVCPATKMKTKVREVIKLIDKDNMLLEMYAQPEGAEKEMKQLEIAYKRK